MKRLFFAIVCAVVAFGCQNQGTTFTISGTFENEDGMGSVRFIEGISSLDNVISMQAIDTTGNFSFEGEVTTPYMAQINKSGSTMGSSYRGIVFVEPGNIKISVNERGQLIASGTKLNEKFMALIEDFATFGSEHQDLPIEELREKFNEYTEQKFTENLDNPLSIFLLSQVMIREMNLPGDEILEQVARLSPQMQEGKDAAAIKAEVAKAAAIDYGAPYIDFALPNTKGEEVLISSLVGEGKWVLIDFWATWCPPCMAEMPHLQEAYAEYHPHGFEICGVSLDRDPQKWSSYCDENLPWVNLLIGDSDVANLYQVQGVPTNFLISPDGKIIAKNLIGSNITIELAKWIKK
ncbi:MAG: TlpA disulfide reductase family protein [Rikenellaceae bacterium]